MRLSSRQRGYDTKWDRESLAYRRQHPLCAMCFKRGEIKLATLVDHIIPHKGDKGLFWSRDNWQSLCTTCHSSIKQRIETNGFDSGTDPSGNPTDKNHPWNRGGGKK